MFQTAFKRVCDLLQAEQDRYSNEFAELQTNMERVTFVYSIHGVNDVLACQERRTDKCTSRCEVLKSEGNNQFKLQNYSKAMELYTDALLIAPEQLVSVCFANRSAALYHLDLYEPCLQDIGYALEKGYPKSLQYKLYHRMAKCYQHTGSHLLLQTLQLAKESIDASDLKEKAKSLWLSDLDEIVPTNTTGASNCEKHNSRPTAFVEPNPCNPSLSAHAAVALSNEFGRHIIATGDIAPGDEVLIELPFCSVNISECFLTHCNYCQKRTPYAFPCRSCASLCYCDQNCESLAWQQSHSFECKYILNIRDCGINMGHLALRTALKVGYNELSSIMTNAGAPISTALSSEYCCNIFSLQGHEEDRLPQDLFWRSVAAVFLAGLVSVKEWSDQSDARLVLASAVLHHMQIMPCNAHEIFETVYDVNCPAMSAQLEIGAGIYATLSLFNHSCDPTVVRSFYQGNACVVKALSPISQSEQVYDNYGALYAVHRVQERASKLKGQYYFECCCTACVHDWPLYSSMDYDVEPFFKCRSCGSLVYGAACDQCRVVFDKTATLQVLKRAKVLFDKEVSELFTENLDLSNLHQKLKKLTTYSSLVNRLVFRPYKTLNDCQEALKHLYGLMGNCTLKGTISQH